MKNSKLLLTLVATLALGATLSFAATSAENWENSCASCHGADGKAQTKMGKKLKIRDYTDAAVQADLKDDAMLKATAEGVTVDGKERMKGFASEIPAAEIAELVKFIRALAPPK